MSRRSLHTVSDERRGMKRSTRMSIIAGVAVFLTLVSGVSFATWTATSTKTATATAGAVGVSTATSGSSPTPTIPTLGTPASAASGHTVYASSGQTITKPITIRNTGSVAATVNNVQIIPLATSSLPAALIQMKFSAIETNGTCNTSNSSLSPVNLTGSTVALSSLGITIPVNGSAILCVSTTFTGDLVAQAGKSITAELVLSTSAGTYWVATDALTTDNRSFTQSVKTLTPLPAPSGMACSTSYRGSFFIWRWSPEANISWAASAAPVGTTVTYKIYHRVGSSPATLLSSTTTLSTIINETDIQSSGTITIVASAPGFLDSPSSSPQTVTYVSGSTGGVQCG